MDFKTPEYAQLIDGLKDIITTRRYNAARYANREQLLLYFSTGKMLYTKISSAQWGTKVLNRVSKDLQEQFAGLRGFSVPNLEKMKSFYQAYADLEAIIIPSTVSMELPASVTSGLQLVQNFNISAFREIFTGLGFSHHIKLLSVKDLSARWFYMETAVKNQWSYRVLEHHIDTGTYTRRGKTTNNFVETLPIQLRPHATDAFKDEYLLDFININPEDEPQLEQEIVANIKAFILRLGTGFSFIGNQYRLSVGVQEFFIDLLFFNRQLQCLVAFELKVGSFQPQHAGQMNFYLTALDETVKMPHENPSIGIILCREKDNTVVEYAIRDAARPMGVATYQLIPAAMREVLPAPEDLQRAMKAGE